MFSLFHSVKSVQLRSFFWSVFTVNLRIESEYRKNKDQKKARIWTLFTQCSDIIFLQQTYWII